MLYDFLVALLLEFFQAFLCFVYFDSWTLFGFVSFLTLGALLNPKGHKGLKDVKGMRAVQQLCCNQIKHWTQHNSKWSLMSFNP